MTDTPPKAAPDSARGTSPAVLLQSQPGVGIKQQDNDDSAEQDAADVEFYKDQEAQTDYDSRASIMTNNFTRKLLKLGVEELGVHPIPEKERTDTNFYQVATLWISMSVGLVPYVHNTTRLLYLASDIKTSFIQSLRRYRGDP